MYYYPENMAAKPMLWLWELRDLAIIGISALISIFALIRTGIMLPLVASAVYAFLSIRFDDISILDFLRFSASFLLWKQQYFEWGPDVAV